MPLPQSPQARARRHRALGVLGVAATGAVAVTPAGPALVNAFAEGISRATTSPQEFGDQFRAGMHDRRDVTVPGATVFVGHDSEGHVQLAIQTTEPIAESPVIRVESGGRTADFSLTLVGENERVTSADSSSPVVDETLWETSRPVRISDPEFRITVVAGGDLGEIDAGSVPSLGRSAGQGLDAGR